MKNDYGKEKELERTKKLQEFFDSKNGEALTKLNLKSDYFLLTCMFEVFLKEPIIEIDINPLSCVSLIGYNCQCYSKCPDNKLQTLQVKELIFY